MNRLKRNFNKPECLGKLSTKNRAISSIQWRITAVSSSNRFSLSFTQGVFYDQILNWNNSANFEPIEIIFYTHKLDALGFFVLKFQRFS